MMSSGQNFTEWTREQKEEYAKKRVTEMKLKNEKLMRRYAEVEQDRIAAEEHNSAITNVSKVVSKKENPNELGKTESKIEYTREWDRGKPDKEHWKSPEHHSSYMNYRASHFEKKSDRRDNWRNYSRNENRDQYRYDHASDSFQGRKMKGNYAYKHHESDQPHVANSFHQSPKKSRGVENQNNDLQWKSHQFYSEKYKTPDYKVSNPKRHSDRGRSYGVNDADYLDNMQIALRASLWENDKISEDQNKQNRVETWVKSVNKSNIWRCKKSSPPENSKISATSGGDVYTCEEYMKNSQQETKLQKNNNHNLSKVDYEIKQYSRERSDRNDSIRINQSNKKFYKNTHNSEYSSSGNNRNENFRRQKFDKGMRNDRERFTKSKISEKSSSFNDGWNDSEYSRMGSRKHGSYNTDSTLHSCENDADTWGISSQNVSTVSITTDDTWGNTTVSIQNDDTWGSTTVTNQNEDTWGSTTVSNQNDDDGIWGNAAVRNQNNDDDGMWSNVDQSHIQWKLSDDETDSQENRIHKQKKFVNKNMAQSDGWEDKDSSNDAITNMLKNKKSNEDSGFNSNVKIKENISVSNLKSRVNKTRAMQTAKHNTTEKTLNLPEKNQNDSDDGGWSTVSEEGEIH